MFNQEEAGGSSVECYKSNKYLQAICLHEQVSNSQDEDSYLQEQKNYCQVRLSNLQEQENYCQVRLS